MDIASPVLILSALGVVFGVGLAFASRAFAVPVDARVADIRESLPGANCAACGYTGCDAYASAVAAGTAAPNLCTVGGSSVAEKIGLVMGIETGSVERKCARVHCAGYGDIRKDKYEYFGVETCAAASTLLGGPSVCDYGCVGLGDCVRACKFGAIFIENGVASVIASRCVSCGMCAAACPKKIIGMEPSGSIYTVRCKNKDRGAIIRKNCLASCIGCKRCQAACLAGAATVVDNLATIDHTKCRRCGECQRVCPQGAIVFDNCPSP